MELLVSLTIGLVVLTAVLAFFSNSLKTNRFTLQNSRLNQELNGAMEMMVRDIRRAGYWGKAELAINNVNDYIDKNYFVKDIAANTNNGGINTSTAGCILFVYDSDSSGLLPGYDPAADSETTKRAGFRLSNGAAEMLTSASGATHGCTSGTWERITDQKLSVITALTFDKVHTSTSLKTGVVCTREVTVTMTGRLVSDASVTQTLTQIVRVRADWYRKSDPCPTP